MHKIINREHRELMMAEVVRLLPIAICGKDREDIINACKKINCICEIMRDPSDAISEIKIDLPNQNNESWEINL